MKVENGKVKLTKRDTQMGNFVITNEDEHYKLQTLSRDWSLRVGKDTDLGHLIDEGLKVKNDSMHHIIAYLYYISGSVVDRDTMLATIAIYNACSMRGSIKREKPVIIFPSDKEMVSNVLFMLHSLNVWLSKDEIASIEGILNANFLSNKEAYYPSVLDDDKELLDDMKNVQEGMDNLKSE